MNNTVHRVSRTAGFLLAWTIVLFALAAAVYGMAGNGDLLARKMLLYAPPETTGLPETEYPGVARMTADYLTGREETFQYTFSDAEGTVWVCFRSHEADHMADCRELIRLAGVLRWIFGGMALVLAGTGLLLRQRKPFTGGMLTGFGSAGAACMALALWALTGFDSLFTAFHRLAFTNDGWLLDPRTDLLIRLMPTEFFVALGARLLLWVVAALLAAGIAAWIVGRKEPGGPSRCPA